MSKIMEFIGRQGRRGQVGGGIMLVLLLALVAWFGLSKPEPPTQRAIPVNSGTYVEYNSTPIIVNANECPVPLPGETVTYQRDAAGNCIGFRAYDNVTNTGTVVCTGLGGCPGDTTDDDVGGGTP